MAGLDLLREHHDSGRPQPQSRLGALAALCVLLLLAAVPPTLAGPRQDADLGGLGGYPRTAPAAHHKDDVHYKYQYAVDDPVSGVVNDRWEQRNGDFVKGQYSLLDPDGKVRTVDYEVDGERGFHAVIRTQYPANALLSIQSASQVHEVYQDSPVNIRAKNGLGVPDFALRNPRFSVRDNLPFNYHALDAAKIGIADDDGSQLQLLGDGLGGDAPLTPREAQRRKYHRDNHLLPHERLPHHDVEDQFVQQDTRQDLHEPSVDDINALAEPDRNAFTQTVSAPAALPSVFNPRAAYISLRPPPGRPGVPPPNPPPSVRDPLPTLPQPHPHFGHGLGLDHGQGVGIPGLSSLHALPPPPTGPAPVPLPLSAPSAAGALGFGGLGVAPGFLFQPAPSTGLGHGLAAGPVGLHTLALLQPPPPPQPQPHASSRSSPGARLLTARSTGSAARPAAAGRSRVVQHLTETSPGLKASRSYYLR